MDQDFDPLVGKALRNLRVPIIINPRKPDLAQGESTIDNVDKAISQKEIKEYVKEKI